MPRKPPPKKQAGRRFRQREYLTAEEIERLIESAGGSNRTGLRDSTLIEFCYRYGLGPSELIAVKWEDVDLPAGKLLIHRKSGVVTEHSISDSLGEQLLKLEKGARSSGLVFESERGSGLSPRSVHNIVASAGIAAGLKVTVHPLMLKESKGVRLISEGSKKKEVQAFLGMKSATSVNEYMRDARQLNEQSAGELSSGLQRLLERSASWEPGVEKQLALVVPASTCNLGPGLDTVGLALSLHSFILIKVFEDELLHGPLVSIKGEMHNQSTARDTGELVYTILAKLWSRHAGLLKRVKIVIDSEVPLGTGLGASDTAILAAVWSSYVLTGQLPDEQILLGKCLAAEGSPENLAASLYGNMVVCANDSGRVFVQRLDWPQEWRVLIVLPDYRLVTPRSRSVLPAKVPFDDAIFNLQRTSLMLAAITNRDEEAFRFALADRMHETYRNDIVPHLQEIRQTMGDISHLGCVLSGGGSSVIVFANEVQSPVVLERLQQWVSKKEPAFQIVRAQVDKSGMTVIDGNDPSRGSKIGK